MTFTLRTTCYYTARRDNSVHVLHHLSTIGADISAPMTMPREEPDVLRTAISSSTEHCTGPTCRAYARRQQATGSFSPRGDPTASTWEHRQYGANFASWRRFHVH